MSRKQMVVNVSTYAISKEDLFDDIKNIASNQMFESDIIVPNVCYANNKPTFFLEEAQRVFPNLLSLDICGKQKLNTNQYVEAARFKTNRIFFCNMYTEVPSKFSRSLNYMYLFNCMMQIRQVCTESKKQKDKNVKIHTTKEALGVGGKSGGRWTTISDFISDCWNDIEVTIHV